MGCWYSIVIRDAVAKVHWRKWEDGLYNVLENSNGNLVIVGATNSSDGDLNGYNLNNYDGWIVSLNSGHNIEWQRVYGGDRLRCFNQCS